MAEHHATNDMPALAQEAVLMQCTEEIKTPKVIGYDFTQGADMNAALESYLTTGFQATALGRAVEVCVLSVCWLVMAMKIICSRRARKAAAGAC